MTQFIGALSDIADRYDVLLCDIWGVIHNGESYFPTACAVLADWRARRGPVILISNSPRPWKEVVLQLDELGAPRDAWSRLVTSGDATRVLLAERAPGPVFRLGPDRDGPLYEGLGLDFTSLEAAAFIACTGPVDDETETPEDYRDLLSGAAARGLEMVCANPDLVVQRGERLLYCGGALAALYHELGGVAIMAGKPHAAIYDLCLAAAEELLGAPVNRRRLLAIGDGATTDIGGANAQDIDALFIGGGIHGRAAVTHDGRLDEAATLRALSDAGVSARYAMAALA